MKTFTHRYTAVALLATAIFVSAAQAHDQHSDPQQAILRAAESSPATLQKELDNGVDINATDNDYNTALMQAAEDGNLSAVKALIAAGAEVNMRNEDAESALILAAEEGHTDIVKVLIEAGADIGAVDKDGENAYSKAIKENHPGTARAIRDACGM